MLYIGYKTIQYNLTNSSAWHNVMTQHIIKDLAAVDFVTLITWGSGYNSDWVGLSTSFADVFLCKEAAARCVSPSKTEILPMKLTMHMKAHISPVKGLSSSLKIYAKDSPMCAWNWPSISPASSQTLRAVPRPTYPWGYAKKAVWHMTCSFLDTPVTSSQKR